MKVLDMYKPVIGMIHVGALPGSPGYKQNDIEIIATALREADAYHKAGIDALIIENMHDVPYLKRKVGPEITAMMAVIAWEIKRQTRLPCGLQILAGANIQAMAVAKASGLDFIRAEGFAYSHIADEGMMDSDAAELLRYRRQINADHIKIFTDIKKKHSAHAITADVDIVETARTVEFLKSDGMIITGRMTAEAADISEIRRAKENSRIPVMVGSGICEDNLEMFLEVADALIVGSWFKEGGEWGNEVVHEKVVWFMSKAGEIRKSLAKA